MRIIGLTGSIGMGKSTTAGLFEALGVPVHSSDAAVHALYAGPAAKAVEAAFPGTVRDGVVQRNALSARVLDDPAAMARLEAIIHPLVRCETERFIEQARAASEPLVVLDIPLLFETGREGEMDAVIVVSAPAQVQAERVLARPGMTREKLAAILARQLPDAQKRARADHVVDTSLGIDEARRQVAAILKKLG